MGYDWTYYEFIAQMINVSKEESGENWNIFDQVGKKIPHLKQDLIWYYKTICKVDCILYLRVPQYNAF